MEKETNTEEVNKISEELKISEAYKNVVREEAKKAQDSGDIPEEYVYDFNGKRWVLLLPHTVMAQKRLLFARNTYFADGTYEAEEEFLKLIAANSQVDGRPVVLNQLDMGEVETLKLAYMDGLLLPLSQGGNEAVVRYMKQTVEKLGSKK